MWNDMLYGKSCLMPAVGFVTLYNLRPVSHNSNRFYYFGIKFARSLINSLLYQFWKGLKCQIWSLSYISNGVTNFTVSVTQTGILVKTRSYNVSNLLILWTAVFSWVPIFVDWTKLTHLWGSKFVAIVFSFIVYTEKSLICGYWNS